MNKEVVVADGWFVSMDFDFEQKVDAYTTVNLKMMTPDKVWFPPGTMKKCKIIFYEEGENTVSGKIVRLSNKKGKKDPCQYRLIRL